MGITEPAASSPTAASSDAIVMPAALDAVEAYASVGEVFGAYREPIRF